MGRQMAGLLQPLLGVPVYVTDVPGATGNAGLTKLLTNPPDGHTMAVLSSLTVSAWASGVGYAGPDDFVVIAIPQQSPSMLFVPSDGPYGSFSALLDHVKANPGRLRVATAGHGSSDDVVLRYFESLGFRMANVPYARPEQRYASPFGGRTHALYEQPGDVAELLGSKRLRPLVVFDSRRHPAFPDVPSSAELGFALDALPSFRMLVVRSGTPQERVRALADAIGRALETPEWQRFCARTYSCTHKYTVREADQRVRDFLETNRKHLGQRR